MKVGTDGVLLGAWSNCQSAKNILDIGSGTGVIALMLAQRSEASILGVEINKEAAAQCLQNFNASLWKDRLEIRQTSLQNFASQEHSKFDLIVSNPPFFETPAENDARSIARSQKLLSLEELIQHAAGLLSNSGKIAIVFPSDKEHELLTIAKSYLLYPSRVCRVKGNIQSPIKRVLVELAFQKVAVKYSSLTIEKEKRQEYTGEYQQLLKDYLIIF